MTADDALAQAELGLQDALEGLDTALRALREPERGAAVQLRVDCTSALRRVRNLRLLAGGGRG